MARKRFTRGLEALLPLDEVEDAEKISNSKGTKVSKDEKIKVVEKISFNLDIELSKKIKAYSYKKRISLTNYLETCVHEFLLKIPKEDMDQALEMWKAEKEQLPIKNH